MKKKIDVIFFQLNKKTNYTISINKDTTIEDIIHELKLFLGHKELLHCDYLELFLM
jgi:hypothetical protein